MSVTRAEFIALLDRAVAAWNRGDALAVAACFDEAVEYADPYRYRFTGRSTLVPFFEPPAGGHRVEVHTRLWDADAQAGVIEYTYAGHHRYHGAALVEIGPGGLIRGWREWQHQDDTTDWPTRRGGPPPDTALVTGLDHVQLAMPPGGEAAARGFYGGVFGLREVPKPGELAARGGVWFAGRAVALHLGVERDFRPARKAHPGLLVDDLQAVRARLAAAGRIWTEGDGVDVRRVFVDDPFGNRLELIDAADAGFSLRPGAGAT
jgi:catechol 2,3-dioxygenase-like lactoylglutathione lyase family enzyme